MSPLPWPWSAASAYDKKVFLDESESGIATEYNLT